MSRLLLGLTAAGLTFAVGVGTNALEKSQRHRLKSSEAKVSVTRELPPASLPKSQNSLQEAEPDDLSPQSIAYFINFHPQANLAQLWQRLGLHTVNFSESQSLDANEFRFLIECGDCHAETFEYDLDDEPGSEVLLKITNPPHEDCRFLVFKLVDKWKRQWKLLGHIDASGKYKPPQHAILLSGGRPWLIVQSQGASGSGIALYYERVFQVGAQGLREVLSYNAEGHQSGAPEGPTRDFSARILSCDINHGSATVTINYTVSYWISDPSNERRGIVLLKKEQKAVFVRRMNGGTAFLNMNRSQVSEKELEAVYNVDSLSYEEFLKYNYRDLVKIAVGDSKRKAWLRDFLKDCDDSREKQSLQSTLKGARYE